MSARWTVAAGRLVEFDGRPFIHIAKEGDTEPVEADGAVHLIVELLNRDGVTPDDIYERHTGHPRRRPKRAREARKRSYSMTYGQLPSYEEFLVDVRRLDPDYDDDRAYWPEGTLYPMELVDSHEVDLADEYGGLESFASRYSHKAGYRGDERAIYGFLEFLADKWNDGDEEAGSLASSIVSTLGYEWI